MDRPLTELRGTLCFEGPPPRQLLPGSKRYRPYLIDAVRLPGEDTLPLVEAGIDLRGVRSGECIRYRVDLDAAVDGAPGRDLSRAGGDLLATPELWLWRGPRGGHGARLEARFELPEGVEASVPWPRLADGSRVIPPSTFALRIRAAFGTLRSRVIDVGGSRLHVAELGDGFPVGDAAVERWLRGAAESVMTLFGEFPVPEAQVLLMPAWGDEVVFGATARGGGAGVILLVGRGVDERAFADDWIAVHELVHLGHPHIRRRDAWLYEGLATYYGPVLRARIGLLTEREAWQELHDGFGRGRRTGTGAVLREESARMHRTHAYWRVYWSGTAILLLADVAHRKESGGRCSLDDEVRRMWRASPHDGEVWAAEALLERARLDRAGPAVLPIAEGALETAEFPDVREAYEWLGLSTDARGHIVLHDDAPGAAARRAIMSLGGDPELCNQHVEAGESQAVPATNRES